MMERFLQFIIIIIFLIVLVACSNQSNNEPLTNNEEINKTSERSEPSEEKNEIIHIDNLEEEVAIKNDKDDTMYTLELTESTDVTTKAKEAQMNGTDYLDFYSNGQGKQAVRLTFKIHNTSASTISMPFFDDIKVKDEEGITLVGGWKEEQSYETEFGYYNMTHEGEYDSALYEVEDDEIKLATSVVLLATTSEKITFDFVSERFNQTVHFEVPVMKE